MSGPHHTDRRDPELQDQAERVAAAARMKMKDKREDAEGGLGGVVASRAGDWNLADQDVDCMRKQAKLWNPLVDKYFRMEIDGWTPFRTPPSCSSACTRCAVRVGRVDGRGAVVASVRAEPHPARHCPRRADGAFPSSARSSARWAFCRPHPTPCRRPWQRAAMSSCGRAVKSTRCGRGANATSRRSVGGPASSSSPSGPGVPIVPIATVGRCRRHAGTRARRPPGRRR